MISLIRSLEDLHLPAAALSPERRIVAANEIFASRLGTAAAALQGALVDEALASVASSMSGEGAPATYRFGDGSHAAWLRLDVFPNAGGQVAILTDVTAEFRRLGDLRNATQVRDKLLHDGKIGTWRYDPDADHYFFSSELSLDYDGNGAPVPRAVLQLIQHKDDRDKDTAIRDRITREGGYANGEMRYLGAHGAWTHLNVHYRAGRRMPSGLYEMFGISQEITAVATARDEANKLSQRLTLALKAAEAAVFEYNFKKRVFWASPELTEMIDGRLPDDVQADPTALFVEEDRAAASEFLADAANETHERSIDLRIAGSRGRRWIRFYFDVKRKGPNGEPLLGVGLLIDVDERKRQEIALAEAERAADYANRTKTEFLANMSHELRTPMNAILGFSGLIEQQPYGPIGPKYAEYAKHIRRSGEHLLDLINDVLDLAKLEAGKLELRESEVDLREIVRDCLTLLQGKADAGGLRLDAELPSPLPTLRADARAVRQLLLNLLSNAVKFTPEGGSVVVRARVERDGGVSLFVTDTGIGMSAEGVKKALSPFGQIDSELARKHEGTGLGLPICRSLMELHGGDLTVESEPGRGTTMTALFPAARAVPAAERRSAAS